MEKELQKLCRITGLSLQMDVSEENDISEIIGKLQALTGAYTDRYDKEGFLRKLLCSEEIPDAGDVARQAAGYHIKEKFSYIVFLLERAEDSVEESKEDLYSRYKTIRRILRNIFPEGDGTEIVSLDDGAVAVIHPIDKEEHYKNGSLQIADVIIDTLGAEAYLNIKISCSEVHTALSELGTAHRECVSAMRIGKIFDYNRRVFDSAKMGVGQIVYSAPEEVCIHFLGEVFGKMDPDNIDPDLIAAAEGFISNDLNIAETARALHMHRNSLIYRLNQIESQTGLNLRYFEDAMTFKMAITVLRYLTVK